MKRRVAVVVVLVAAVAFGMATIPSAKAANTTCDEPNGQEVTSNVNGNVDVPPNGVCHIHGFTISGSIFVGQNAKLFTRGGTIVHGNVSATQSQQVNIEDHTQIDGTLMASGGGGFGGFACGSTIGRVLLQNLTSGTWVIGQPTSAPPDGYVYQSADPDLNCTTPNAIPGNVILSNNNVGRLKLAANTNIKTASLSNNTTFFESIKVESNTLSGSLLCSGNVWTNGSPAITNEGLANTVAGTKSGQCASL
jgi:hypothetical protein